MMKKVRGRQLKGMRERYVHAWSKQRWDGTGAPGAQGRQG